MIKKILAAASVSVVLVLVPTAAGAATARGGAGAGFGAHVSTHARTDGFPAGMNPGDHRGFAGFAAHH